MHGWMLLSHSWLRWGVLALLLWVLVEAYVARVRRAELAPRNVTLIRVLTGLLDVQLLLGLVMYFFTSPFTRTAFADLGAAMQNKELRFFAVEHITGMLVALALVHVGNVRVKRAEPAERAGRAALWLTLVAVAVCLAIPWWRVGAS